MRLVVFGWGNVARGDDGAGPLLLQRLERADWENSVLIEDFQLQLEHALDLKDADLALFLDAGKETAAPFFFREIFPREGLTHTSHALPPEAVLFVAQKVLEETPPPSFLLCVRGESFGLGESLSEIGAKRLEEAWAFLERLGEKPSPEGWRALQRG